MFANLLHLFTRREEVPDDYDLSFVQEVHVRRAEGRSRRVERLLIVSWILIALKSWAVWWAIGKYRVPINAWWVIAPTIAMGVVCTLLYARKR